MIRPKPLSVYDPQLKHGLGYENPYTLKKAISQNPKLYDALNLHSSKVHVSVCDTEEMLEAATISQIKMENKLKDPIAIKKKQNFHPINYGKLNDLYKKFVPQVEISAEQKYFLSASMTSETPSNASTSRSPPATMPSSIKRESIDVQENSHKRIKILECLDFELQLQHQKEKTNCEYSLKNLSETSWISKMEKLENENVSLEFQSQKEIKELIKSVNQKTYAYGDVRAQYQDLLITISELKAMIRTIEKDVTSVRRPSSRGSSAKNNVLTTTKNHSEDVEVHVRINKKTNVASKKNVVQNKKIVTNVDVKNATKAKDVLCVSCNKNVLTLCHDKCLLKYKLSINLKVKRTLFTTPRTAKSKSLDATSIVAKTSGCSKHMTGNLKLLKNLIEKFMDTVRFRSDHFVAITSYGDYLHGNITICHVYYVEGLGHNLFSVGQFCNGDLEVAFRSKTCYVRNLEGDDLLTCARDSNLYTISILEMVTSSPVCLMSKATSTKSWLWH
ncbi:hypothetical protein Tco_0464561 [Tanacetum coccineum]